MAIKSLFRVQLGTQVVLDFGDLSEEEPEFPQQRVTQTQQYLRASHVRVFDRGNISNSIVLSKVVTHANNGDARQYVLNRRIALDGIGQQSATVNVQGQTGTFTYANATITNLDFDYGMDVSAGRPRTIERITITGGAVTFA